MKKDFIPYEQALELKEIGFDEECFGCYEPNGALDYIENRILKDFPYLAKNSEWQDLVAAPTFSQAFRFFREKCNIVHSIDWMTRSGGEYPSGYIVHLRGINGNILNEDNLIVLNETESLGYEVFPTYEEAELSCLKKLIKIVKNK